MALRDRILGLLGDPSFNLGIGLLSAPPGTTFGQTLGHGVQFASERQRKSLENEALRNQLLEMSRRKNAIQQLTQGRGLTPAQQQFIQAAPTATAFETVGGLLGFGEQQQFQTDTGKLFADLDVAERTGNTAAANAIRSQIEAQLGPQVDFDDLNKVRRDVIKDSQPFLLAKQGFERVQVGAQADSPAGDLALIYGFMKVNDPTSVVREGEFATAQNAGGIDAKIRNLYNRILTGERLTPDQRTDFLNQSAAQFRNLVQQQQRIIEDASGFAERQGFAVVDIVPEFVIPNFNFEPQETDTGGPVGDAIERVFTFDPATGTLTQK